MHLHAFCEVAIGAVATPMYCSRLEIQYAGIIHKGEFVPVPKTVRNIRVHVTDRAMVMAAEVTFQAIRAVDEEVRERQYQGR